MLRFRVATLLLLFFLVPVALHGGLDAPRLALLWAALALCAAYVSATTVNDLADRALDAVNVPHRPFASGRASARQMVLLHVAADAAALVLGFLAASWAGALVMLGSVALNVSYSLRPARFAYRTHGAHAALAVGYVLVPYVLGLATVGARPGATDAGLAAALLLVFFARILLKDLRDREGDRLGGKVTLVLRYGKRAVCGSSIAAGAAGALLLLVALRSWAALPIVALLAGALVVVRRVGLASSWPEEERLLGLGAKLGNGALVSLLALASLRGAGFGDAFVVVALVAFPFAANAAWLARRPEAIAVAYRG